MAWLVIAAGCAAAFMWVQDGRYGQPTLRPRGLVEPSIGETLPWPEELATSLIPGRPALLHFFNPDCPCSRFNLDHVRELSSHYGARISLILVIQSDRPPGATHPVEGLSAPFVHDVHGSIADLAGVYATPTAVVLDRSHRVSYVGNYTLTRYCADPAAQPARRALETVLGTQGDLAGSAEWEPIDAPTPFGCPLPSDDRENLD